MLWLLLQVLHQPGEKLLYGCRASQETVNLSAVTVAPWVSFQALNWCLAYPGFSEQCELYEWQENWHHKQDQQDTSSQRSNSIANILKRLLQTSQFSLVQSLSRVRLFATPWSAAARPPCPSPTPRVHSDLCPLSQRCHPAISSSVISFSSFPRSLPASESFPMSQLFASGG